MKVSYAPLALLLVVAPLAVAQKATKPMKVSGPDKMYMDMAGHSNAAEIGMAKMAKQKSKNPDVLRFAEMMIRDHTAMHTELKALASQRGTNVPDKPNAKQMAMAAKLQKASGAEFDKMYWNANLMGHKEAYALATKAMKNAKDPGVRAYFKKGAPKIKMHLDMLQKDDKKAAMKHMGHG